MLAYIPAPWILWVVGHTWFRGVAASPVFVPRSGGDMNKTAAARAAAIPTLITAGRLEPRPWLGYGFLCGRDQPIQVLPSGNLT